MIQSTPGTPGQVHGLTGAGLMAEKEPLNFNVPGPLKSAFQELLKEEQVGEKQKWSVCGAAILLLLDAGPEMRRKVVSLIRAADSGVFSYDGLVAAARAGRARQLPMPTLGLIAGGETGNAPLTPPPGPGGGNGDGGEGESGPPKKGSPGKPPRGPRPK